LRWCGHAGEFPRFIDALHIGSRRLTLCSDPQPQLADLTALKSSRNIGAETEENLYEFQ
jgi:hypothetical protein